MQHFAGISWLRARYEITIDGEIVQHGALRLPDIAAGESETVEIAGLNPEARRARKRSSPCTSRPRSTSAGHRRGSRSAGNRSRCRRRKRRAPRENTNGERTEVDFDTEGGLLTAIRFDGQTLLTTPPVLSLWRAPTDNDGLKLAPNQELKPLGRWRTCGTRARHVRRRPRPQQADVRWPCDDRARDFAGADDDIEILQNTTYLCDANGVVTITEDIRVPKSSTTSRGSVCVRAPAHARTAGVVRPWSARVVSRPQARRRVRSLRVDHHRPVRPLRDAAGARRPQRHPLVRRSTTATATASISARPHHSTSPRVTSPPQTSPRRRTTSSSKPDRKCSCTSTSRTAASALFPAAPTRCPNTRSAPAATASPGPCARSATPPRRVAAEEASGRDPPACGPNPSAWDARTRVRRARGDSPRAASSPVM